jgi:putative transposase
MGAALDASFARPEGGLNTYSSESFLDSLKNERVHGATHAMRADAQADLFDHIEAFYKRSRRHSAPAYGSPPYPKNWIGQRVDRHGETT